MESKRIGLRQVISIFEQSVQDGQVKPFELSFFTKDGRFRKITCHKALKEIEIEKEKPVSNSQQKAVIKKPFSPYDFKVLLIQNVNPIDDRDKIKTVKICLLVRYNGIIIDHRR